MVMPHVDVDISKLANLYLVKTFPLISTSVRSAEYLSYPSTEQAVNKINYIHIEKIYI